MSDAAETLLEKAKRCFKQAKDTGQKQRDREKEDLSFQVAENQWDAAAKASRLGGMQNGIVTPPRPMLSVSLLHQPMQLVQNQAAAAKLGVSIHPVSEKAQDDLAEMKQGLYRRIERDSLADQARLWALDRAKQCGRGWYRVNTGWDEDGDDPFDQEITIERILHQECVFVDPAAQKPDFRDAEWAMVTAWMPLETFKRQFPDAKATLYGEKGDALDDGIEPDWVRDDDDGRAIQVAEYFYKVHEYEDLKVEGVERTRKRDKVLVRLAKVTGFEELEDKPWNGHHIPLIPVIGRELQPFDNERRWEGMVRPARDGQKLFNFAVSTLVERMSLEPKTPFIGAEGQFEDHESEWAQANTRNLPYLEYKAISPGGQPVPPPMRAQIDQSGMSLAMIAVQEGKSLVQSATAVYDPSLGESSKRKESGRAIIALQQQADAGTSNYLQSLATISMPYEALVVLDLMPAIYDRPGRVTRVLGGEDEEKMVMLNAPFSMDQTGRPVQAEQGQPGVKEYSLAQGKYSVSVTIGKSFQTRLQQGQEELGQLLESLPPELQILLLPTYMRFRDTPGAEEAAELMQKYRDSKFPGLANEEGEQPTPEQLQSELQAMKQQMQQMQEALKQAAQAIETDQAKQAATVKKAEIDAQAKMAIAQMGTQEAAGGDALKITLEKMSNAFEEWQTRFEAQQKMLIEQFKAAHETALAAAQGNSVTRTRENGQEQDQERENESSRGSSEERSSEQSSAPEGA